MSLYPYVRQPLKSSVAEGLFQVQGGACQLCKGKKILEIDHINGVPNDWRFSNLRLLCHSCNIAERNRLQRSGYSEREKMEESSLADPTEALHQIVDYQAGSPEMRANDIGVPKWVDAMSKAIMQNGGVTRHAALNAMAADSGLTYQPVLRAYNKLVYQPKKSGDHAGPHQPFIERKTEGQSRHWVELRDGWKLEKNRGYFRPVPDAKESIAGEAV